MFSGLIPLPATGEENSPAVQDFSSQRSLVPSLATDAITMLTRQLIDCQERQLKVTSELYSSHVRGGSNNYSAPEEALRCLCNAAGLDPAIPQTSLTANEHCRNAVKMTTILTWSEMLACH